jgi:tetratricopeptide (TPR) repeat protein
MRLLPVYLFPFTILILLAAAPPNQESPDDLIRAANAAFLRGDTSVADQLYAAAEERTADPGLVAFNRGAVLFQRGRFWDAKECYDRVLEDKACPAERAAKARFNRGTCWLRLGGSPGVYRSAILDFEKCLDLDPADEPLKADARHNLELAKLLWAEANKKAAKPETPNTPPPEPEYPDPPPQKAGGTEDQANGQDIGDPTAGPGAPKMIPQPITGPMPKGSPTGTDAKTAGNNANLPVLKDEDKAQPISPESARELLRQKDAQLQKKRQQMNDILRGPDRPGVRDW